MVSIAPLSRYFLILCKLRTWIYADLHVDWIWDSIEAIEFMVTPMFRAEVAVAILFSPILIVGAVIVRASDFVVIMRNITLYIKLIIFTQTAPICRNVNGTDTLAESQNYLLFVKK